jgi:hypothetical protein
LAAASKIHGKNRIEAIRTTESLGITLNEEFRKIVDAVAARMRRPILCRCLALSLLAAGGIGLLLAVARLVSGWGMLSWFVLGAVIVVPLAGVLWAFRQKIDPLSAVRAIDDHYDLKSRTMTLWSFLRTGKLDEARQMAVDDAWSRVKDVKPDRVVSVSVPKTVYVGGGLAVLAVILAFTPINWLSFAPRQKQRSTLPVEAAEMTQLAPLPHVTEEVAEHSTQGIAPGSDRLSTVESPLLTAGSGDIVSGYFDKTRAPQTGP